MAVVAFAMLNLGAGCPTRLRQHQVYGIMKIDCPLLLIVRSKGRCL